MPKAKEVKANNWEELPLMLTRKEISDFFRTNIDEVTKWFDSRDFPETDAGKVEKTLFKDWYYKTHDKSNYNTVNTRQVSEIVGQTVNQTADGLAETILDKFKQELVTSVINAMTKKEEEKKR